MYKLFVDSDCDVTKKEAEAYGAYFIPMPYVDGDKEIKPYVDFEEFDAHAFYQALRDGKMVTTCAISPEEYKNMIRPFFEKGEDILYVHFSAAMTMTFDAMHLALKELAEEFPERKMMEIDAKGITIIGRMITLEVMEQYKQGKSMEEIIAWANEEVDKYAVYFFADNLKFFKRSGRVSGLAAFMGNLIGIKPIIYMSQQGKMESIGKAKGRSNAMNALINYVDTLQDGLKDHRIIVGHADAMYLVDEFVAKLKEKFGEDLKVEIVDVNPTAGAHCGPDTLGICFHAIHR